MKKIGKLTIIFVIAIFALAICFNKTYAYNVDLDSSIYLPMFIWGSEGKISVSSTDSNYKLYWQAVEFSNYQEAKTVETNGEQELAIINQQKEAVYAEVQNLSTIADQKQQEYKQAVSDNKTPEEIEAARVAYNTAVDNYNNKRSEYNTKRDAYNNKREEIKSQIKALIPEFVESNWKETTDGSFTVDTSQYTGEKVFVIWAKLVSNGTTTYNESTYTMSGTKEEGAKVTGVGLDKTEVTISEGSTYMLAPQISPANAENKKVEWSSSNEQVATVQDGKVTGIKEGEAVITVKTSDGNYTATCKVTVSNAQTVNVTNISLDKSSLSMNVGDKSELIATITPKDATNKSIIWISSDENIATVKDGQVTAIKEGEVTITAKSENGNFLATCKVTVSDKTKTTSPKIPDTGTSYTLVLMVSGAIIVSFVLYRRKKKFKI